MMHIHTTFFSPSRVLSLARGINRPKNTKLSFPRGNKNQDVPSTASISKWPLTSFDMRLANLPVRGLKKIRNGKQRSLTLRMMQPDSWRLVREKELLLPCEHKKLWEKGLYGWGLLFKERKWKTQWFTASSVTYDDTVCVAFEIPSREDMSLLHNW